MRNNNVLNLRRALPCMSWSPKNLYNLWKRTVGPKSADLTFKLTTEQTVFQQRWKSKAAVRAYHGDFIPEKVFKRWYLPQTIPDVRPRRQVFAGGDKLDLEEFARRKLRAKQKEKEQEDEIEEKGMAPVGSLMFTEVERRLDVFVFRCCFVHSVYEARRLIIHGYVKLNGRTHAKANTRLAPGDMISVDPEAMRFFKPPHGPSDDVNAPLAQKKPKEIEAEAKAEEAVENLEDSKPISETEPLAETTSETTSEIASKTAPAKGTFAEIAGNMQKQHKISIGGRDEYRELTPFHLPQYASPWLYVPAYIEVSWATCSAIYVRHPTARPGYSEIPTPYDADGALVRYAWEWYMQRRPRMRSQSQLARMPEDRVITVSQALHRDWTRTIDPGWTLDPHAETAKGREDLASRRAQREREQKKKAAKGREAAPHMS